MELESEYVFIEIPETDSLPSLINEDKSNTKVFTVEYIPSIALESPSPPRVREKGDATECSIFSQKIISKYINYFKKVYIILYYIHLIIYIGNILHFNYKYIYPILYIIRSIM